MNKEEEEVHGWWSGHTDDELTRLERAEKRWMIASQLAEKHLHETSKVNPTLALENYKKEMEEVERLRMSYIQLKPKSWVSDGLKATLGLDTEVTDGEESRSGNEMDEEENEEEEEEE